LIGPETLTDSLRSELCAPLTVSTVPIGYHIETGFRLPDGDPLDFYLVRADEGLYRFEDDGTTIPNAVARGFDLKSASRDGMLRHMLAQEGAHYDTDLVVRTDPVPERDLGPAGLRFISALIRTRDLFVLSRENVAASFADDVMRAISASLPATLVVEASPANEPGSPDLLLRRRDTGLKAARVYAAGSDLRLMDALVEHQARHAGDSPIVAVVDRRKSRVTERRFNRATNQGLAMAVVDDQGDDWVERVFKLALANVG
jgi:hypothetical protein